MKKKKIIRSLLTLFAVSLVLCIFSACHQKSPSEGGEQLSAEDSTKKIAADTIATEVKEEVKNNARSKKNAKQKNARKTRRHENK